MCTKSWEKAVTSQEPGQNLPACLGGSLKEVGAAVTHYGDKDIGDRGTRKYSLV